MLDVPSMFFFLLSDHVVEQESSSVTLKRGTGHWNDRRHAPKYKHRK
jgi:hypothetical protein